MAVNIHLKTSIAIPGLEHDGMALPGEVATLRDLLNFIGPRIHFNIVDPESGELQEDFQVIINGKEVWFYPGGLDAPLRDNDEVEINIVPLGGG